MGLAKRVNSNKEHIKPEVNIFAANASDLNDQQIMNAANYLREERLKLAQKLIKSGKLDASWLEMND